MISTRIPADVRESIRRALAEDIGSGDITTSLLIPDGDISTGRFIAKETFILAGIPFAQEVFRILDPSLQWSSFLHDGEQVGKGDIIAEIYGETSVILAGERVSLNILQRLSGIATLTKKYSEKIHGMNARIVDTRKTAPGLRFMEKYAVRTGGGHNHRFGLFDGILIKNNHITAVGSVADAIRRAKNAQHLAKIEIEVSSLSDLAVAIEAGADIIMLDNMSEDDMREAVRMVNGRLTIEASGGITLDNVREVAATGVDLISVGALTHSATAVDISLHLFR